MIFNRLRTWARAVTQAGHWLLPEKSISQARWGHCNYQAYTSGGESRRRRSTPHASLTLWCLLYLRADPASCAQSSLARRQKKVDQQRLNTTWYLRAIAAALTWDFRYLILARHSLVGCWACASVGPQLSFSQVTHSLKGLRLRKKADYVCYGLLISQTACIKYRPRNQTWRTCKYIFL